MANEALSTNVCFWLSVMQKIIYTEKEKLGSIQVMLPRSESFSTVSTAASQISNYRHSLQLVCSSSCCLMISFYHLLIWLIFGSICVLTHRTVT
jgi:hypothetical protein